MCVCVSCLYQGPSSSSLCSTCLDLSRTPSCGSSARVHVHAGSQSVCFAVRERNRGAGVPNSTHGHVRSSLFRSASSRPPPLLRSNSRTSGGEDGKARRFAGAVAGLALRQQLNAGSPSRTHSLSKSLVTHATTAESPWKLMLRGRRGPRQHKGRFPLSIA